MKRKFNPAGILPLVAELPLIVVDVLLQICGSIDDAIERRRAKRAKKIQMELDEYEQRISI